MAVAGFVGAGSNDARIGQIAWALGDNLIKAV